MFCEEINDDYIVMQAGTSEGTQIKYRKEGYWYKKDNRGHEGMAEYLASRLLEFSSLDASEFVTYERGTINGQTGCRSRDFLNQEEELITFYRLYYNEVGKDLSQVIGRMETMEERIEYVIAFIKQSCDLDVRNYLRKILTLDMIILNEDRHLNNLAVIMTNNKFKEAPIFDNGVSLLTANLSVNWRMPIKENVYRVVARPFSGSHIRMVEYMGTGFELNSDAALKWLKDEEPSKEKEVLEYQIERYQEIQKR